MKKKEMTVLTNKEIKFYEKQKYVTYARDIFVRMKIMKRNLKVIIKSEIIVTTQENLDCLKKFL